jgi:small subunit ribosomal protein S15
LTTTIPHGIRCYYPCGGLFGYSARILSLVGIQRQMALDKESKRAIITKFQTHKGDTGSPEVQIALLSEEINRLTEHLKIHRKDNHSRRGLLQMVGNRRRTIEYLKATSEDRFKKLAKELKL